MHFSSFTDVFLKGSIVILHMDLIPGEHILLAGQFIGIIYPVV